MDERVVRAVGLLEEIRYLTLATSDADGSPWASTVWYAAWPRPGGGLPRELLWLSHPEARHSQNLLARPACAISVFDSTQPADTGVGLQVSARAERVPPERLDDAMAVFSAASVGVGGQVWDRSRVTEPAPLRAYVARVKAALLLGGGRRVEVPLPASRS